MRLDRFDFLDTSGMRADLLSWHPAGMGSIVATGEIHSRMPDGRRSLNLAITEEKILHVIVEESADAAFKLDESPEDFSRMRREPWTFANSSGPP